MSLPIFVLVRWHTMHLADLARKLRERVYVQHEQFYYGDFFFQSLFFSPSIGLVDMFEFLRCPLDICKQIFEGSNLFASFLCLVSRGCSLLACEPFTLKGHILYFGCRGQVNFKLSKL